MERFCKYFKEHVAKRIIHKKKEMIPLRSEERKLHHKQKAWYICKKNFGTDDDNKKYHKVKDHCYYTGKHRGAAHDICNLKYKTSKEICVAFHNGSTYDYKFIMKELELFWRQYRKIHNFFSTN